MRYITYGLLLAILLQAPSVLAEEELEQESSTGPSKLFTADSIEECKSRWDASESGNASNAYFVRRCIRNVRLELAKQREAEHIQLRRDEHGKRQAATSQYLQKRNLRNFARNTQKRLAVRSTRRERNHKIDSTRFYEERQSRRLIMEKAEGEDRIHALRRKIMSQKKIDLCTTVGVISKYNNPCKNYDSYRRSSLRSPYLEYLQ